MNRVIRGLGALLITIGVILAAIACTRIAEGVRHSPTLTATIVFAGTFAVCGTVVVIGSWLALLIERATKQRVFLETLMKGDRAGDTGDTGDLLLMSGRSRNGRGAAN
jgi:hypothetical protein